MRTAVLDLAEQTNSDDQGVVLEHLASSDSSVMRMRRPWLTAVKKCGVPSSAGTHKLD
jgi:hypothetical protein